MTNLERYKTDLNRLINTGIQLHYGLIIELDRVKDIKDEDKVLKKIKPLIFSEFYEPWYTECLALIDFLLPSRNVDFVLLYKNEKRKNIDFLTYTISDYLIGLVTTRFGDTVVDKSAAYPKFKQQLNILNSVKARFESSLFDIKQLIQADIFDSELDSAKELLKKGFLRGAGAIAGVVLEKHLKQVISNHKLKIIKKKPTIADFNDLLKKDGVIETPNWRFIQHLGDLRNLCDHDKEKEPTKEQIIDLIEGVEKITKTLF